jgi:GAF domain-containing protein
MIVPPHPQDEALRLDVLRRHDLLSSAQDPFLDALAKTVARSFRVPMAAVSLIDADHQFFKAHVGLPTRSTPRSCSFCAHTLWWPAPLVVLDAWQDERFIDNPLVTGTPLIRFYAGTPIHLHGVCLGTLCVLDHRPWSAFGDVELRFLRGAAMAVEERLIQLARSDERLSRSN